MFSKIKFICLITKKKKYNPDKIKIQKYFYYVHTFQNPKTINYLQKNK